MRDANARPQVSCGVGHTNFLLDSGADTASFKSYTPPEDEAPAPAAKATGKRPAAGE